jgi:predicted transcriptional regulator/transcriptional regulator with XRE-family HTH domain
MATTDHKLFLGGRLGRLRRELAISQTRMAEDLGVSPSYLNHLERNQRPVTAQVLLRLAQTYDLDLRAFSGEGDAGGEADLQEALADPMFKDLQVPRHEIVQLMENSPGAAEALVRLYRAYGDRKRRDALMGSSVEGLALDEGSDAPNPTDWVRDYIQARHNHFPELDEFGERMADEIDGTGPGFETAAARRMQERHGVQVRIMPVEVMSDWLRRYDPHRRQLRLAETLSPSGRSFAIAYQLALFEDGEALDALVEAASPPDLPTRRLLKVSLTNYLAAAAMMPYARFHQSAESLLYDIGLLAARFGVGFEQACHRLTTLARPTARGVPFFLLRVDAAGNISKRFASTAFPFARVGGACPRWNIHGAFRTPGRIITQVIETPDGARYFTLARTVERAVRAYGGAEGADLAVGLGCELKHAPRLIYAKGSDLTEATEVGPTCRLCERPACRERAAPPITRTLTVEEWTKTATPYPFSAHG